MVEQLRAEISELEREIAQYNETAEWRLADEAESALEDKRDQLAVLETGAALAVADLIPRLQRFTPDVQAWVVLGDPAANRAVIDVESDPKGWPALALGASLDARSPSQALPAGELVARLQTFDPSLPVVVGFDDYHYVPNRGVLGVSAGSQGEAVITIGGEVDNPQQEPE